MPLPASVPVGTVTGRWYTPSGANAVGTIIFLLTESVEVPDDPDGVVLPLKTIVDVPAGVLNQTLPAGVYQVSMRLSELYKASKIVEVTAGEALNLPDAIGMLLPDPDLYDPVRSVDGYFPDAYGNIDLPTGGGGGAVDSVFGRTGVVVAQSGDYTKAQVGLSNVDNTSDLAKPISTLTQTALDGKQESGDYATNTALTNGLATKQDVGDYATNSALTSGLAGKANTVHTHVVSDITGLQDDINEAALDQTAVRYGAKALTMDPHDLSWVTPQYIEMPSERLFQFWVPLPVGTTITGIRVPFQLQGIGPGEVHFGIYQDNNAFQAETGNVASILTNASLVAEKWVNLPLTAPIASTGAGVWITALSTLSTGAKLAFANTDGAAPLPGWLLNPSSHRTAVRTEGVLVLPATISPNTAIEYIDALMGVY